MMDDSGPAPLTKLVIDSLAVILITKEQVNSKLQCSICWEFFSLDESVHMLPCNHVYHKKCIRSWLELHGTCPVCRKIPGNDDDEQEQQKDSQEEVEVIEREQSTVNTENFRFESGTSTSGPDSTSTSSSSNSDDPN